MREGLRDMTDIAGLCRGAGRLPVFKQPESGGTCVYGGLHGRPWAGWVIARLGGWKGCGSQRPVGPITLKNGLDDFNGKFREWVLAN